MKADRSHTFRLRRAAALQHLTILTAVLANCHGVFAQGFGGPARVEVTAVEERTVSPTVRLVGSVMPRKRSLIASEVEGFVLELPVDVGDRVSKGDRMCMLRDTPYRFARDEAAARVAELQAAVEVVKADLKRWEYEEKRMSRLLSGGQGAEKEAIDATANYESGKARVSQAEASLKAAEAVLARMQDDLDRTEVRAPFDGYVVAKNTELGSWVAKGGAVVELVDLSTARIRVNVPESCIAYNPVGTEASVFVDALKQAFEGRVARVIPDADLQARTFPIDIDIPNSDGNLKAGMFIRGNVNAGPADRCTVVPKNAIVTRGPISYLFVVRKTPEGHFADMRQVSVVGELLDRVAVKVDGLAGGDSVVIRGNETMFGPGPVIIMSSDLKMEGDKSATPAQGAPTTRPSNEKPLASPAGAADPEKGAGESSGAGPSSKDSHQG